MWFQFVHEGVGLALPSAASQLLLGVAVTTAVWFGVTMATPPTETAVLQSFYDRVRPFAHGWRRAVETGAEPPGGAAAALLAWMLGCAAVYAALFGTGMALYGRFGAAAVLAIAALAAAYGLFRILPRTDGVGRGERAGLRPAQSSGRLRRQRTRGSAHPEHALARRGSRYCKPVARSDAVSVAEEQCAPAGVVLWVRGPSGPPGAEPRSGAAQETAAGQGPATFLY